MRVCVCACADQEAEGLVYLQSRAGGRGVCVVKDEVKWWMGTLGAWVVAAGNSLANSRDDRPTWVHPSPRVSESPMGMGIQRMVDVRTGTTRIGLGKKEGATLGAARRERSQRSLGLFLWFLWILWPLWPLWSLWSFWHWSMLS